MEHRADLPQCQNKDVIKDISSKKRKPKKGFIYTKSGRGVSLPNLMGLGQKHGRSLKGQSTFK